MASGLDNLPPWDPMQEVAPYPLPPPPGYGPVGLPPMAGMDSGMAAEPPQQFPDPSGGFWSRLAQGGGLQAPQTQGSPSGLEVLLSALVGFANQKGAMAQHQAADVEKRNKALSESAAHLANRRWEQRKIDEAAKRAQDNIRLSASLREPKETPEQAAAKTGAQAGATIKAYRAAGLMPPGSETGTVVVQGPKGPIYARPSQAIGQPPAEKPQGAEKLKLPTAAERGDLTYDIGLLNQLGSVRSGFNRSYVGPGHGVVGKLSQATGRMSKDESRFRSGLAGIRNQILKMRSGGAVTPQEGQRLLDEMPTLDDPPDAFQSKLDQFEDTARYLASARRETMSQTGVDLSRLSPLPKGRPGGNPAAGDSIVWTRDASGKPVPAGR